MDLRFTTEEIGFRDEVRTFFRSALPDSIRDKLVANKGLAKDDIVTWQRILNAKGWAVANWPVEWGGTGWTPVQQYMFQEELQLTPAPQPLGFGVTMVGPVMIAFGSEEQKKRFLPRIANLDDWWCQGFSEPGAGSDLAAHLGEARRRPLCRQWTKDLDDPGAARRLDFLSGAHRSAGQEAGGDLLPADRHEDAGDHCSPDRHDRRRTRGQRSLLRRRRGSRRKPRRRGEQRLGLCEIPARP